MEQKFIFYLLSIVSIIILLYQYYQYLKKIEGFTLQRIDGNIIIEPGAKVKIGKKNTENDAIINSAGELRVKRIKIGNRTLNETMFKAIKSFANIHRMETERGDKLCLKDENGITVCCNKEEMGILTGQTPFNLKIADKKVQPVIVNNNKKEPLNVDDEVYPTMTGGLKRTNNNSLLYDKKFVMIPANMHEITKSSSSLYAKPDDGGLIANLTKIALSGNIFALVLLPLYTKLWSHLEKSISIPSDSLMIQVPGKNYFCNIENKSPKSTLSNYELE